mmetsp:Transcript_50080/g.121339  ORF Transcript_50080/g.121339 Transcript_50080/m.121339 type:complete len:333 (-) Transcript_50080:14-1012(-)
MKFSTSTTTTTTTATKTEADMANPSPSPSTISNVSRNELLLYIVTVDSRNGRSVTDLDCYNEVMYDASMFNVHIHDDPRNICVSSPAAQLCGLDLKLYFHHDRHHQHQHHRHHHHQQDHDLQKRTNSIATLLTFNPEIGTCNHVVFSKAYILLNNGQSPLNRSRLANVVEFIDNARNELYNHQQQNDHGRHGSNENVSKTTINSFHCTPQVAEQEDRLQYACREFLRRCSQYRQYHKERSSEDETERRNSPTQIEQNNIYVDKRESGVSDAATCHHDIGSKNEEDDDEDGNDKGKALPPSLLLQKDHQSPVTVSKASSSTTTTTTTTHCIGT